jgi:hypothetical protein
MNAGAMDSVEPEGGKADGYKLIWSNGLVSVQSLPAG